MRHHLHSLLNKTTALLLMIALLVGSVPPISAKAAAAQIRQEINILAGEPMTSTGTLASQSRVLLDTTAYSGTKTYYFEVVHSGAASNTGTIKLSRAGTSTYDASIAGATSTSTTLTRSAAFTPPAGQTEYTVTLVGDGVRSQTVKSARIIVIQNSDPITATQTQIEIGNYETGKTNTSAAPLNAPKYWNYDSSKWNGAVSATAEVTWQKTSGTPVPTYVGQGTKATGIGAVTPTLPLGWQENDIFILAVETANQAVPSTPTGWNVVLNSPQGTGTAGGTAATRLTVFWKRATTSESDPTVGDSGDHQYAAGVRAFRGVVTTGDPWDVTAGNVASTASTAVTMPSVTTTVANTLILWIVANGTDTNTAQNGSGTWTNAGLTGITDLGGDNTNSGNGGGITMGYGVKATAGATGTTASTLATSSVQGRMTIALKPAVQSTTFTAILQESDGTGDGFTGWTNKFTITTGLTTDNFIRSRSTGSFTPTQGRNYRLVTSVFYSSATYQILNAKIIVNSTSGQAGDISDAAYTSKSFYVGTQGQTTSGVFFSSDGTKMYTISSNNDTVYQYTLSTAWDVSTASYASKSFSVGLQDSFPQGLTFSSDGTKMYVAGDTNDSVYQYTLSTAWDVSTASYASKSFSVGTQDTAPEIASFSSDGTKMYVAGDTNNTVYQYTLSTAWDISTASYASKSFSVGTQISSFLGLSFSSDGTSMYGSGFSPTSTIYQYTLSTAWDVSTASYASKSLTVFSSAHAVYVSSDGINVFTTASNSDFVYQYTIYNGDVTKLEPQYLLANTSLGAGTSLQNFLTKWDSSEWSGITTQFSHVVDAANGSASVIEVNTAAGTQVANSVVTAPDNQKTSAASTPVTFGGWTERQPAGNITTQWTIMAADNTGTNLLAAAYGGRLYTSSDSGVSWTERQPIGNANYNWYVGDISSDGSFLIAAIYGGRIYTSSDSGASWTERQPAGNTNQQWISVSSDADGTNLMAMVYGGRIYTSSDSGASWTERQPALNANYNWRSTATDATGTNLMVGYESGNLYTSSNSGANWTQRQSGLGARNWYDLDMSSDGVKMVAGTGGTSGRLYTSTDSGVNWTERQPVGNVNRNWTTLSSDSSGTNIVAAVGLGVGTGGGRLYTSSDSGVSWTEHQPYGSVDENWYWGVDVSGNGQLIIAGINATTGKLFTATASGGSVTYMTMPANGNLDVKATTNNTDIYGSRILVAVSQATTSSYEQSGFRFFGNANSTNVGAALAALNTAVTLPDSNSQFRLRTLLHVSGAALDTSGQNFKLQYATRSGTCDTSFSGETYTDVTASTPIAYYNNFDAAGGATLTTNASDPTHSGHTVVAQSYVESNNFTNPSAVAVGQDGLWDFALYDRGTTSSAVYCLRIVKSDGSLLNTYTYIPQVTTAIYTPRGGGTGNVESSGTPAGTVGGGGQGGGSGTEGGGSGGSTGGGGQGGGATGDVGMLIPSSWFAQDSFFALITSLFAWR